jgi:apolipoprotein N-acyltransferase
MERTNSGTVASRGQGSAAHRVPAALVLPVLCLLAAGIGVAAWTGQFSLAPIALLMLVPVLVFRARRRSEAFCVAFVYYGTATRAVPRIISYFFPSLGNGEHLIIWAAHCALLSLPWALMWVPSTAASARRALAVLVTLVLLTVPPIGLFHWGSPLMAAGLLFPGWRWAGLLGTGVLAALMVISQQDTRRINTTIVAFLAMAMAANVMYRPPAAPTGWHAVSLEFGRSPELWSDDMAARREALAEMALFKLSEGATVVIFPESISGSSRRSQQALWQRISDAARQRGATVLVGEENWNAARTAFRNALVGYGTQTDGGAVVVSSMVPMPIGDWKFGLEDGAETNIFGTDVIDVHGRRAAFSMCYEDFLLWPHRGLLLGQADLLVSATNQWPSRGTSAEAAQDRSRVALARLAGVALLTAKNR